MASVASDLLRRALARSGLTARQLAIETGISEGRISDYLSGRHDPRASRLAELLEAAGHQLSAVPRLDRNGILLAELLELGDALSVGQERRPRPLPPLFKELVRPDG